MSREQVGTLPDVEVSIEESLAADQVPPVVVIEPSTQDTMATLLDHERRLTVLESAQPLIAEAISEVATEVSEAQATADFAVDEASYATNVALDAENAAIEATEIAVETADETGVLPEVFAEVEAELPADVIPRKPNILFDSVDGLRGRVAKR
jgi:hypothetical protein